MARSNARLEVSGAGKTEDGLVQYNEEVNKLGDDLRELYETIRVNVDEEEQWKVFDFGNSINAGLILLIWQDDWKGVFLWDHCLELEQSTEEDCLYRISDNFDLFFNSLQISA